VGSGGWGISPCAELGKEDESVVTESGAHCSLIWGVGYHNIDDQIAGSVWVWGKNVFEESRGQKLFFLVNKEQGGSQESRD